jgi:hypothetical protein
MKTRIIHTKLWKDQWFVSLSKDAKFLWLYLLTNEKINISGIYELSDREILFDTSLDTSVLGSVKKELSPKALFFKGWVKITNVERYNSYRNSPSNQTAFEREMSYLSDTIKKELETPVDTSVYTPINNKSEIINKKPEIINKKLGIEELRKQAHSLIKTP